MIVSPPWLKRTKVAANLRVVQKQISLDLELELEAGILQLLFDTPLKLKNGLTFVRSCSLVLLLETLCHAFTSTFQRLVFKIGFAVQFSSSLHYFLSTLSPL